jgi:hypothetical protein
MVAFLLDHLHSDVELGPPVEGEADMHPKVSAGDGGGGVGSIGLALLDLLVQLFLQAA